ncbi:MAG TPA: penicillin-binding transpeptidase domain-containing protein [Pyrinomonadaceae bacterium]|nr:penicillin-binding transpeptidase domain-containing protein [Pyrinomonadaceae bacterium]
MTAKDVRRQKALVAREQSASLKALERKLHRPLTKRERTAELRRVEARHRRDFELARRRAEAARLAAIARQRAIDAAMRNEVQGLIAKDDITGEDPEVRRAALNALGNHAGTVVVMDPMTGRVYSVVNQEWALRRGFKPCSTIKLVTGVAGLSEKIIPPVEDENRMDLTSALAHSNNPYFERVGGQLGFDKMVNYAKELGLGEKTGANVNYEFTGRLPELKPGFVQRRMFSYADGFEVTPMQLGTLVSAMANGGKLLAPQILKTAGQIKIHPTVRRKLDITGEVWQRMIPGMVGAVNYGSGKRAYDPTQTVAGKTGTCIGEGGWVGLFTSYAPLANPRLAVVVIAQGTDAHRHFPAAVAGEIYRQLNHRFGTAINMQVATTDLDDEEKEAGDDEAAGMNGQTGDAAATTTTTAGTTDQTTQPAQSAATATDPAAQDQTKTPAATQNGTPKNTVKRVLMTIPKKVPEPNKNNGSDPTAPPKNPPPASPSGAATPNGTPAEQQRPRRTQPEQP